MPSEEMSKFFFLIELRRNTESFMNLMKYIKVGPFSHWDKKNGLESFS